MAGFVQNLTSGALRSPTAPQPAPAPSGARTAPSPTGTPNALVNAYLNPAQTYQSPFTVMDNYAPMLNSDGSVQAAVAPVQTFRDQYGNVRGSQDEATRINNFGNSTNTSVNNLRDTNANSWRNTQTDYNQRGNAMFDQNAASQAQINTNRGNNALNLRRSMSAIAGGVRQGLRSGGVNLANMNALDSGASEAMARAFAQTGTAQVGDARNQAAGVNRTLDTEQGTLQAAIQSGLANLSSYGRGAVADSQNTFGQGLNVLRTSADTEGLGNLVDTQQDDSWANGATDWLLKQDAGLSARMSGIQGWSPEQANQTAYQWDMAGREGSNPFAYLGAEQGVQEIGGGNGGLGAGAPITQVPLFTRRDENRGF